MLQEHRSTLAVLYVIFIGFILSNIEAFSPSHGILCLKVRIKLLGLPNEIEGEKEEAELKSSIGEYTPPKFSASFLAHMQEVKVQKLGKSADTNAEGIQCDGEPPIDPSRLVQDDGIDSEFLNEYNDR